MTTTNANGVPCPYDLTALVNALPAGISAEWHTANNTLASTLVPNAQSVVTGTYYVFAKDNNGCYSAGVLVQVICQLASCTAPQSLSVEKTPTGFLVKFNGAAFPPSGATPYTVKRRLASDPDVVGSYTIIGTPEYDRSAVDNTRHHSFR